MSKAFFRTVFGVSGVTKLYRDVVVADRLTNIRPQIRRDLQPLLERVNVETPRVQGKFTELLARNHAADDATFFANYA
ncbi:MAG: hypothetical protein ACK53V_00300, partial [Planctomycetota bacterium]